MTTTIATRPASFFSAAFGTIASQFRAANARRSRRIALLSLMDMDASRLDDLGLSVSDVMDALASRH
ncbi:MAG: hypothetical protein ABIO40_00650 [Devosia sp.]